MGRDATIDMPVRVEGNLSEVIKHCLVQVLPPIMCLYMEGKPTQVSAGSVKAIQKNLQDEISVAKSVTIIGVHPNPVDTHVWDSIASCQGEIGYVEPSSEAFNHWMKEFRPQTEGALLAGDFKSGVIPVVDFIERSENASQ